MNVGLIVKEIPKGQNAVTIILGDTIPGLQLLCPCLRKEVLLS